MNQDTDTPVYLPRKRWVQIYRHLLTLKDPLPSSIALKDAIDQALWPDKETQ